MRGHVKSIGAFLFIGMAFSSQTHAEDNRKIWECNNGSYYIQKTEHNLWLVEDGKDSYVKFYESRIEATYYMHGLDRRWDWEGGTFSVRLKPNNTALYFDFSAVEDGESTTAKSLFGCKQIQG